MVVEPGQGAASLPGCSWSGCVDSGPFEVSLAMGTDYDSRYCLLIVCTEWEPYPPIPGRRMKDKCRKVLHHDQTTLGWPRLPTNLFSPGLDVVS